MGNYDELKQAVSEVIKANGNQEITGQVLQNTLLSIINTVGVNATFSGIATTETNPGTPDQNVFYIAVEPGIYSNFEGKEILPNQLCILYNKNNVWSIYKLGVLTTEGAGAVNSLSAIFQNGYIDFDSQNKKFTIGATFVIRKNGLSITLQSGTEILEKDTVISATRALVYDISENELTAKNYNQVSFDDIVIATYNVNNGIYRFNTSTAKIRVDGVYSELMQDNFLYNKYDVVFGGTAYFNEDEKKFVLENAIEVLEKDIYGDNVSRRLNANSFDYNFVGFASTVCAIYYDAASQDIKFIPYSQYRIKDYYLLGVIRVDVSNGLVKEILSTNINISIGTENAIRNAVSSMGVGIGTDVVNIDTINKQIEIKGTVVLRVGNNKTKSANAGFYPFVIDIEQGRVYLLVFDNIQNKLDVVLYNDVKPKHIVLANFYFNTIESRYESSIINSGLDVRVNGVSSSYYLNGFENIAEIIPYNFGKYIDKNTGEMVDNYNRYYYSEFIEVSKGDIIYYHGYIGELAAGVVAYDKDKNKLKNLVESVGYQIIQRVCIAINDEDAKYIRICGDIIQSEKYSVRLLRKNDLLNNELCGKKIAIIGDSISTMYAQNAVSFTVNQDDIDNSRTLVGYPTNSDVGKTIGDKTIELSDIGNEVEFVPNSADLGKQIGVPVNYNPDGLYTWWWILSRLYGFSYKAVCWSGSSMTSHEDDNNYYKGSYAWHPSQISKLAFEDEQSRLSTDPDIVIIYRGTNDFSHLPYAKLTDFCNTLSPIPETDLLSDGGFGFKEAYCITIKKIREKYPYAKIYCCTLNIFKRINYDSFPVNNGDVTLPQYNNAIREVANYMGCGLIEFDKDGITFENCYPTYISDSATIPTHPNQLGHSLMALQAKKNMLYE